MQRPSAFVVLLALLAGCGGNLDATPTAVPSSEPSASAVADAPIEFESVEKGSMLAPGTYRLAYGEIGGRERYPSLAFDFTLAEPGWQRVAIDGLLWNDNGARFGFAVADNVYTDPCDLGGESMLPPVGPTVTELANALGDLPGIDASAEHDVYLGYGGHHVTLTAPEGSAGCEGESGVLRAPGFPGFIMGPDPDTALELWILSVEGTRVIVLAYVPRDASSELRDEVQAIFDSIRITP
jgi:hypothetical protein